MHACPATLTPPLNYTPLPIPPPPCSTFMKQRALRMFPPTAFGASFLIQELPIMLVCSFIFSGAFLSLAFSVCALLGSCML